MDPFAHLASGLVINKIFSNKNKADKTKLLFFSLLGAFLPDLDYLFFSYPKDHHHSLFHTPLFWLSLVIIFFLFLKKKKEKMLLQAFSLSLLLHFIIDWYGARTAGIRILYPLSDKVYSLFPLQPKRGKISIFSNQAQREYLKFYFSNQFLVGSEILFIIGAVIFLLI